MKDREYLYTVLKRGVKIEGTSTYKWQQLEVTATSMVEVSRVTGTPLDDLQYVTKVAVK